MNIVLFSTPCNNITKQNPIEMLISAGSSYCFIIGFSFVVFHWILAIHADEKENLPPPWKIYLIVLVVLIIPVILFIIITIFYYLDIKAYIKVHLAEAIYATVLNFVISIVFVIYGLIIILFICLFIYCLFV